ncbi:MAG: hypothetical protein AUK47_15570 [Deltaproteobacteria bacterium CG2_30_63_29]|nr:MAG: hypothetical protein AUK47_15570 [Deltaproteobacteria bacterium CG2_30_63_29]
MNPTKRLLIVLFATLMLLGAAASASANPGSCRLWGEVIEGPTATPVADAVVRVGNTVVHTDVQGRYELQVPRDLPVTLEVFADLVGEPLQQTGLSFDCDELYRPITLMPASLADGLLPGAAGVPLQGERPTGDNPPQDRTVDLRAALDALHAATNLQGPTLIVLPADLPPTIAVGRRFASTCTNNPITRVDQIDLETYAAGVVTAEIGVFRALTAGEDASLECFKTFAIAARSYALWWWANNPAGTPWNGQTYNLDDTACNQRYDDGPYPAIILRAVQETAGMVLIDAGTSFEIDKYEYAASCGRNGSRPEHTTDIVPDNLPGIRACTGGGWCGHDTCAAHEDNPNVPGTDKCLVRGICQWGAAERSIRGDDYLSILTHYQPYLEVHTFATGPVPVTSLVGFVREGSIQTGTGIASAQVELDTGQSTLADASGYYVFEDVDPGVRTVSATAAGYIPTSGTKQVLSGIKNWASLAMTPVDSDDVLETGDVATDVTAEDVATGAAVDTSPSPDLLSDGTALEQADPLPPGRKSDDGCCTVVNAPAGGGLAGQAWWVLVGLVTLGWVRRRR